MSGLLCLLLACSPASAQDAPASGQRFDLLELAIDGNTVLPVEAIEAAVLPFLGPDRNPSDVDAARSALEQAYQAQGYKTVSVTIPQQTVRDGVVRLQVVESSVRLLTVSGSAWHSLEMIRRGAPSLAEGTVPDFDAVQDDILALNQQVDRRVTPALKAGPRPGTVDVELVVDDTLPLHGSLELNNRQSPDTAELRVSASLSYDNLWQRGHSLGLSVQTAPESPEQSSVAFASYLARFGRSPWSLLFTAIKSDSEVATIGGTQVLGDGEIYGLRGFLTLPGNERLYHSLAVGADYKNSTITTALDDSAFATPVEYLPFTLAYSLTLDPAAKVSTQVDLSTTFASGELGSDTADLDANRAYARGGFFQLRAGLANTIRLPADLQGLVRLRGQWTDQPLITNEQLSAGGADTVRGYLEAEALGDYGVIETLELGSPELAGWLDFGEHFAPFEQMRAQLFLDAAWLALHDALPEQDADQHLLSLGLGLRFKFLSYFDGNVEWAMPMLDGPVTRDGQPAWLFSIAASL